MNDLVGTLQINEFRIYIPIWLDYECGHIRRARSAIVYLHSNMVRL